MLEQIENLVGGNLDDSIEITQTFMPVDNHMSTGNLQRRNSTC